MNFEKDMLIQKMNQNLCNHDKYKIINEELESLDSGAEVLTTYFKCKKCGITGRQITTILPTIWGEE